MVVASMETRSALICRTTVVFLLCSLLDAHLLLILWSIYRPSHDLILQTTSIYIIIQDHLKYIYLYFNEWTLLFVDMPKSNHMFWLHFTEAESVRMGPFFGSNVHRYMYVRATHYLRPEEGSRAPGNGVKD